MLAGEQCSLPTRMVYHEMRRSNARRMDQGRMRGGSERRVVLTRSKLLYTRGVTSKLVRLSRALHARVRRAPAPPQERRPQGQRRQAGQVSKRAPPPPPPSSSQISREQSSTASSPSSSPPSLAIFLPLPLPLRRGARSGPLDPIGEVDLGVVGLAEAQVHAEHGVQGTRHPHEHGRHTLLEALDQPRYHVAPRRRRPPTST